MSAGKNQFTLTRAASESPARLKPPISYPARNACNLERRLAVGFGQAMTLKADSKSALRTSEYEISGLREIPSNNH
jgi:hypothetical protein